MAIYHVYAFPERLNTLEQPQVFKLQVEIAEYIKSQPINTDTAGTQQWELPPAKEAWEGECNSKVRVDFQASLGTTQL